MIVVQSHIYSIDLFMMKRFGSPIFWF